jgi:hypothetical protein
MACHGSWILEARRLGRSLALPRGTRTNGKVRGSKGLLADLHRDLS